MNIFNPTVFTEVTAQMVADLMVTAFEGGSNYWCTSLDYIKTPAEVVPNGVVVYSHPEFWAGDFELLLTDAEAGEDDGAIRIKSEDVIKGVQLMADKHRAHFRNWIEEDYDAETGDVFLQLCCFGEVRYG